MIWAEKAVLVLALLSCCEVSRISAQLLKIHEIERGVRPLDGANLAELARSVPGAG